MKEENRAELLTIIREFIVKYETRPGRAPGSAEGVLAMKIQDAHFGSPDGWLVTMENMHLFRQYRNSVSPNAWTLVGEAYNAPEGPGDDAWMDYILGAGSRSA